jgi:hypothetical protein
MMRPLVVVEGAICDAYWDKKLGKLQIEELEWTRLRWRAAGGLCVVDLVTENALHSYLSFIAPGVKQALQVLTTQAAAKPAAQ